MHYKHLLICGWLMLLAGPIQAQELRVVAETDSFTDYEWRNDALRILPPHSLLVASSTGRPLFDILERSITRLPLTADNTPASFPWVSPDDVGVVEIKASGSFRNKSMTELHLHRARYSESEWLITRYLKLRVYKSSVDKKPQLYNSHNSAADHPLASGNWFKIPVTANGIYRLDASYLTDLGIPISNIDPRKLQLWGTNGYPLPESNSEPRPTFDQIPIIVKGESDGSFDNEDEILFYGNSPHQAEVSDGIYNHILHPYSDTNFVFLRVGPDNGLRISMTTPSANPVVTHTTFRDFIWKDEELQKPENRFRSGRFWLGQSIGNEQSGINVSVFKDTLAGLFSGAQIQVSAQLYARSEQTTSYTVQLNGSPVTSQSVGPLSFGYNSSEGAAANPSFFSTTVTPDITDGILDLNLNATLPHSASKLFVDWIRLVVERNLEAQDGQLIFFTPSTSNPEEAARYVLQGFTDEPLVLDVTQPENPLRLPVTSTGSNYLLDYTQNSGRQIIASERYFLPAPGISIQNQNLHGINTYPDYIIVTSEALWDEANKLAAYRQNTGLSPVVVTQQQIFNEFSGGVPDPVAIRDFLKYLWDTATASGERLPRYVVFFGDSSYDTKGIVTNSLTNHVLTYQSLESVHRTQTFVTDDFFGYMDDAEGDFTSGSTSNTFMMDLGVGRIPVQTPQEADIFIDKIRRYEAPQHNGDWQNLFTFVADDDFPNPSINRDLHVFNADVSAEMMQINEPGIRIKKIYEFSYPVEITGAGRQIPEATKDFINTVNKGTLVLNYSGHGNEQILSDEELFLSEYISDFTNQNKLCVLVTATCQFGRFDDTDAQSGAEKFVLAENGGAIAALTTTRVVYTSSVIANNNFGLNVVLSQRMSERAPGNTRKRLGDIFLETKNSTIPNSSSRVGASINNKKFVLLGDPATLFRLPEQPALIYSLNGEDVLNTDTTLTIRALDRLHIAGNVIRPDSTIDTSFNGELTLTVFDAERAVTIQENGWSCSLTDCQYFVERDVLFKGRVSVTNGSFNAGIIIPKDISSSTQNGRIVLFAQAGAATAGGAYTGLVFDGINPNAPDDTEGPSLDVYLNDESFINGNLVNNTPTLIIELEDETGINTTGNGVGHEITATINTSPEQTYVLNEFYESNLNDFSSGKIEYPLDQLPKGNYTLKVRAWDVLNNPTEKEIYFEVGEPSELSIRNMYNYPNPMNNRTLFTFDHNQPGVLLDVSIRIYTLSGKPVHHLRESIQTTGSYASIPWDGRDRDRNRLGNGTYIYVLKVSADTPKGRQNIEKTEKLVIIR